MVAVVVVVVVLGIGVAAAAVVARRHADDVEPSVREFTEFRDAISRQVVGVETDTHITRRHLERQAVGVPAPSVDDRSGEHRSQN